MEKKNNFNVMSITKFNKLNKAQRKSVILTALSSLVFAESSLAFLTGGILTLCSGEPTIIPALLFAETAFTAGIALGTYKYAKKQNEKNNKLVNDRVKYLNNKLYESENIILARKLK